MRRWTRNHKALLTLLALTVVFALGGCRKKAKQYGREISDPKVTEAKAILSEPDTFKGKTVTIEGKIVRECPTGCWFDVKDGTAIIHVDINPSGFAIPQKVGNTVTVEGEISVQNDRPVLVGKGVEIR